MKRIAETRRRATEISELKTRNSANAAARADASVWLESEQQLQREMLQANRHERKQAISQAKTTLYSIKKDEVSVLRQMRRENEAAVAQQRQLEHERAVERKAVVREHHSEALARKAKEREIALTKLAKDREAKRQELDEDAMNHLSVRRHCRCTAAAVAAAAAAAHTRCTPPAPPLCIGAVSRARPCARARQTYDALAEEEQRLIASLQKWKTTQSEAIEQLDGLTSAAASTRNFSRGSTSRPVSRGGPSTPAYLLQPMASPRTLASEATPERAA